MTTRPGPRIDAHEAVVFDALADHMDRMLDEYWRYSQSTEWKTTDHSPVEYFAERMTRQFGPGGAAVWGRDPAHYSAWSSWLFLVVLAQRLNAILILLRSRQVVFSMPPLVRSMFEIHGYVRWLIGPEVRGARERAARSLQSELSNFTREATVAKLLGSPDVQRLRRSVKDMRQRIPKMFYGSELNFDDAGNVVLFGEPHPGLQVALNSLTAQDTSGTAYNTEGVYAYLSNASHPTLHIVEETLMQRGGKIVGIGFEDATMPYKLAMQAMWSFAETWELVAAYYGLDQSVPHALLSERDGLPKP